MTQAHFGEQLRTADRVRALSPFATIEETSTHMYVDIDGATRIARLAAEFDWTWYDNDVLRLCEATGWEIAEPQEGGSELRTNLRVQRPEAYVFQEKRTVRDISCLVTDVVDGELPWVERRRLVVDAFADLSESLAAILGFPDRVLPGVKAEMGWARPSVTIHLNASPQAVWLTIARPGHRESASGVASRGTQK